MEYLGSCTPSDHTQVGKGIILFSTSTKPAAIMAFCKCRAIRRFFTPSRLSKYRVLHWRSPCTKHDQKVGEYDMWHASIHSVSVPLEDCAWKYISAIWHQPPRLTKLISRLSSLIQGLKTWLCHTKHISEIGRPSIRINTALRRSHQLLNRSMEDRPYCNKPALYQVE